MTNQSSASAELSFEEKHPSLRKNEDGLYWDWKSEMWVTQEAMEREFKRMADWRAMMGSDEDVAALNRYEQGMGY